MRSTIILILFLIFAMSIPLIAYEVHPTHPRIFLTSDDLPRLRARCGIVDGNNRTQYASEWESHKAEFAILVQNRGNYPMANAFLYLMTGETSYANTAITNLNNGQQPEELAIAYDWVFNVMNANQKQTYANMIIDLADPEYHYDYSANNGTMGLTGWNQRILIYAGLALYNEGINDVKAVNYLTMSRYRFYESNSATISNWDYVAGDGAGYKAGYDMYGVQGPLDVGMAWDSGTSENFLQNFNHLKNAGWWYLIILRGGSGQWDDFQPLPNGDGSLNFYRPWRTLLYRCASVYGDPRAQKFGDLMTEAGGNYVPYKKYENWKEILWHDKTITSVDLNTLPKSRFFGALGDIVMRTGWDLRKSNANTDIWAMFKCEKYAQDHTHLHQNHFTISRGLDQLALDSGGYDNWPGDHRMNYYHLTAAHNSILIDGDQRDMGRNPRNLQELQSQAYNRGSITRYGHNASGYTYGLGDATKAYLSSKVSNFTRQFVLINEKYFVVFDRVSAIQPSSEKVWLLHTVSEPVIEDSAQWGSPEFGFSNSNEGGKRSSEDTRILSAVSGNSKLYLTILQPTSIIVSKVGGSNTSGRYNVNSSYEFWHQGSNHPADDNGFETTPEMGHWRIEVRPDTATKTHRFLNVLQPCDESKAWVETSFIRGNTGQGSKEMHGAHIKDATQPGIVLFAKNETKEGPFIDEVTFSVNDTGILSVLLTDMEPKTYNIYKDGAEITDSPKTVFPNNNTLFFRCANGGGFSITEGEMNDPPPAPPTDVHFE